MTVSRTELETLLASVESQVIDPRAGIYGPKSVSWKIGKEAILFLGGGKAALLQLAHPYVAHAIDQHSNTQQDPLGRFQRTFEHVFRMVFGDLEQALNSARRVHSIHRRVSGAITEDIGKFRQGMRYEANDEQALLWVHATLIQSALEVYDLVVRPLDDSERDRYYQESKRFAALFGIPERVLPTDFGHFMRYYRGMLASDTIQVGGPARELATFLFTAPGALQRPLFGWLQIMTAGLLDERSRKGFGFDWGIRQEHTFSASVRVLRATYPLLPARLRYIPAYIQARRRLAGKIGPDRIGMLLERLVLTGLGASRKLAR